MSALKCLSCKNFQWVLEVGKDGAKMIDECYFPANNHKVGHAKQCEEFEQKPDEVNHGKSEK